MKTIDRFSDAYRWLSNFWPCKVEYEGVIYPSVENAYHAAKTTDIEARKKFETISAKEAKKEGRKVSLRPDWEETKVETMWKLVMSKFSNDENLMWKLIMTHDTQLVEGNTWGDTFWGVCFGKGRNELGRILMAVRHDLLMLHNNDQVVLNRVEPVNIDGELTFKFYDKEDYEGKVDGEMLGVLCELILEYDEEMCKEPL
jgi:hypothetical protein